MRAKTKCTRLSDEVNLQITSMADIFTIILVFLLKSYATSVVSISPTSGMKMPEGQSLNPVEEALKIEIERNSVQIESKPVANLSDFRFQGGEIQPNLTSSSVSAALETERNRAKLISNANPDVKESSKVLIVADQRTPYVTLKTVLASAAVNGFTDYKLVVVNKE